MLALGAAHGDALIFNEFTGWVVEQALNFVKFEISITYSISRLGRCP